jgi:exopolyphosphatase / guanosine-5'-triphosphate,3'-diphosphate pyrophosphatase
MARAYRIAAIDVGTNSIHMIIAESHRHGYRVIDKEREMVQLGLASLEGRPLTDDAIERGVSTLKKMGEIAQRWSVDDIVAVATSAIREAPNRRKFLSRVQKEAGIQVRVISGEEEADLINRAIRSAVDFHGGTALAIDIGGGSVELIVGTTDEVFFTRSEPIGALRMAQKFDLQSKATAGQVESCRAAARKALRKSLARVESLGFDFVIGSSGTIVTLADLAADQPDESSVASGLKWLNRRKLTALIDDLALLDADERAKKFNIEERRAATLLAGAIVLEQILIGVKKDRLRASDAALREGIVERALEERSIEKTASGSVRRSSVLTLAERTAIDEVHASQVARLALRIFDQTRGLHDLGAVEREFLEYAALLHEVGTHVSFQGHHKHSYYLISHAGLKGFTAEQVAIVANVARYYRKATPDLEHQSFAQLSKQRQEVVMKLAAILRIAAALDRGRRGAVRDVAVEADKNVVRFTIRPRDEVDVELEAATRKAKYFSGVFERGVKFEIAR